MNGLKMLMVLFIVFSYYRYQTLGYFTVDTK